MRDVDLKSVAVAAGLGALALLAIGILSDSSEPWYQLAIGGAIVGGLVQMGVRLTGVS